MTWYEDWQSLAARIEGLRTAVEFLALTMQVKREDPVKIIDESIAPEFKTIIAYVQQIGKTYRDEIPPAALQALNRFVGGSWGQQVDNRNHGNTRIQPVSALVAFRSEFEYLIRDVEIAKRNLVELAFEHLRRQLVVDEEILKKWQDAFRDHETHCERLGAVHLLSYGIWAFKISTTGAATDLVFPEPIDRFRAISRRIARAHVLTEWKRVRSIGNLVKDAKIAREQTQIYTAGVLGDLELKNTRYIVLVIDFNEPGSIDDVTAGAVVYKHIILSVKPAAPASKQARSRAARKMKD